MLTKLASLWDSIRGSLWFVPSVMAVTSVTLAFGSLWIDHHLQDPASEKAVSWLYSGGANGARDVLSTVASSMITLAGVIFSITVVALTLASQQFGPRLLRNFMRDFGNQIVLGTFISIFLFCLIILRAVRTEAMGGFVPNLSVTITLLLALIGSGVVIYFFHHATSSIRASHVIAAVSRELDHTIDRLFPDEVERGGPAPFDGERAHLPVHFERQAARIRSSRNGYLQMVDAESLVALASAKDFTIQLACHPGAFLACDATIALVYPATRLSDDLAAQVNGSLTIGDERTVVQDVLLPAQQLAEMAIRALSPGTNDPSTALACIDRLGGAFIRLAHRRSPSPYRYDESGTLRLIAHPVSLSHMVKDTVGEIRQYCRSSTTVTLRLLEAITMVLESSSCEDNARAEMGRQADMILRGSIDGLTEEWDRRAVLERYNRLRNTLAQHRAA